MGQKGPSLYFFYYYPVGVDVPQPRVPWATLSLLASFLGLFLFSVPFAHTNDISWWSYGYRPMVFDPLTPLTACFLHANWLHLLGNMLYLWVFGPALERAVGRVGFLLVFCGCGYLGNLAQGIVAFHIEPASITRIVVGASGAISGLLGLYALRYFYSRVRLAYWAFLPLQGINRTGIVHLPAAAALALWAVLQISLAIVNRGAGGTAYGAHLGGLLTGLILGGTLRLHHRAATELMWVKAQRFRRKGNVHAAVGQMDRYLQNVPWDDVARHEYAQVLCIAREWGRAHREYHRLVVSALEDGDMLWASNVYLEGRRMSDTFVLPPAIQRDMAFRLEKSTRFSAAATAYLDYARFYPDEPEVDHALARAATLLMGRVGRRDEGLEVLDQVIRQYPESPWRHLLEQERRRALGTAFTSG